MSNGEFDIIKRYFQRDHEERSGVVIGIGDDCAILDVPEGYQLAVTTDSLVSGVHFFEDVDPYRLGYKSLAVNLSDIAAMGATAKWVSLAITLPSVDEAWLAEFCRGFFELADKYNVRLIGGDTTKGPLSITVSAKGIVKKGHVLTRSGAQVGDTLCVTGHLGNGAVGLACKLGELEINNNAAFIEALELTEPRLNEAAELVEFASSCIDISDGLSQDLSHILKQSQCAAEIALEMLPISDEVKQEITLANISQTQAWQFALTGGDDYELLFTVSNTKLTELKVRLLALNLGCIEIGKITALPVLQQALSEDAKATSDMQFLSLTYQQQPITLNTAGWDHFK